MAILTEVIDMIDLIVQLFLLSVLAPVLAVALGVLAFALLWLGSKLY